jgi:predicted translin family RNA/ssDNA-binding protein
MITNQCAAVYTQRELINSLNADIAAKVNIITALGERAKRAEANEKRASENISTLKRQLQEWKTLWVHCA